MIDSRWPGRVAFVLWTGDLGGAERHTVELVRVMRDELDVDAQVLFIQGVGRSEATLDALAIPWKSLGMQRGRDIVLHPKLLGAALRDSSPDAVYLGYGGYLARTCRMGGYSGTLMSVEHGGIMQVPSWTIRKKVRETVSRAVGERTLDGTICVSNLIKEIVTGHLHADTLRVIYNGVDMDRYRPAANPPESVVFGHAGRLIEGKGVINLVKTFDRSIAELGCRLLIAGDGPARGEAERIVDAKDMRDVVEFCGVVDDMPAFWRRCSVVVHPTTQDWKESFCLAVVEGMASGLPALVSSVGALPEIVTDGLTGSVIPAGDITALRDAMVRYATDSETRMAQGLEAHRTAVERFDLRRAAREYLAFGAELTESREAH